jgi:hypothetical protein
MTESSSDQRPPLKDGEDHLCVLAEHEGRRFDLIRSGEAFLIRAHDGRATDRDYESLPALLAGLQSFFLEFRVAGQPAQGFAELAAAQEKAKADVIEASRRIYAAIDGEK